METVSVLLPVDHLSPAPQIRPGGRRAQRKVEARLRAIGAVRGILEGHSYQKVAEDLGYANRGTVYRIVQQALARHEAEVVDELRVLELARLDHIQAAFYPAATAGDVKSAEVVLKLMAARCRLLQLDRPPITEPSTPHHPVVVGGTKDEFEAALRSGADSNAPADRRSEQRRE